MQTWEERFTRIINQCRNESGKLEASRLAALSKDDKHAIFYHQTQKGVPVFADIVLPEWEPRLRKNGYRPNFMGKDGNLRLWATPTMGHLVMTVAPVTTGEEEPITGKAAPGGGRVLAPRKPLIKNAASKTQILLMNHLRSLMQLEEVTPAELMRRVGKSQCQFNYALNKNVSLCAIEDLYTALGYEITMIDFKRKQ